MGLNGGDQEGWSGLRIEDQKRLFKSLTQVKYGKELLFPNFMLYVLNTSALTFMYIL